MSIEENNKRIVDAIARSKMNFFVSVENGMKRILDFGVEQAFAAHDSMHHAHLEMGDSYGWILFKDAVEIDRRLWWDGKEGSANATEALNKIASHKFSTMGYVGYVVAGMADGKYFAYKAEIGYLHKAASAVAAMNFNDVFKEAAI